jgi:hypothetical protein
MKWLWRASPCTWTPHSPWCHFCQKTSRYTTRTGGPWPRHLAPRLSHGSCFQSHSSFPTDKWVTPSVELIRHRPEQHICHTVTCPLPTQLIFSRILSRCISYPKLWDTFLEFYTSNWRPARSNRARLFSWQSFLHASSCGRPQVQSRQKHRLAWLRFQWLSSALLGEYQALGAINIASLNNLVSNHPNHPFEELMNSGLSATGGMIRDHKLVQTACRVLESNRWPCKLRLQCINVVWIV